MRPLSSGSYFGAVRLSNHQTTQPSSSALTGDFLSHKIANCGQRFQISRALSGVIKAPRGHRTHIEFESAMRARNKIHKTAIAASTNQLTLRVQVPKASQCVTHPGSPGKAQRACCGGAFVNHSSFVYACHNDRALPLNDKLHVGQLLVLSVADFRPVPKTGNLLSRHPDPHRTDPSRVCAVVGGEHSIDGLNSVSAAHAR